jgi:hypothetical protein
MKRGYLVRTCGVGVILLALPLSIFAQGTGGGGATTTGGTSTSGGLSGPTPIAGGGGGGTGGGGTASTGTTQTLTTSTTMYSASSGAGSATSIPSNSNFMANTMVNPYSLGLPTTYSTKFGPQNTITSSGGPKGKFTYLFVAPPTTTTTTATTTTTTANGFNTYGIPRNPAYSTVLSPKIPLMQVPTARVQTDLRDLFSRSSQLESKGIQIDVQDNVVVLKGNVVSEDERRIAEGMARMTPGVIDVRNELVAPTQLSSTK